MTETQPDTPDLDAYFERIGYAGPTEPALPVLNALLARHTASIPFENLDVVLGRGVSLEPAAVEEKLVRRRRGGYCFEQNGHLLRVLRALGFQATPHAARVRLTAPRTVTPPRTHLFVKVSLDGTDWLADAGFGSLSLVSALRLGEGEQGEAHERRRLVREDGRWFHQYRAGDAWCDGYEFTGEEMPPIDRELSNWWTSTHPASKFRQNVMASLAGAGGTRLNLLNREFTWRRGAEILERRVLAHHGELVELLADIFGLVLPEGSRLEAPNLDWNAPAA